MDINGTSYTELVDRVVSLQEQNKGKDNKITQLEKQVKQAESKEVAKSIQYVPIEVKPPKPTLVVNFGEYSASLIKGVWAYERNQVIEKAKPSSSPKYKDPAQFKIMEEYEQRAEDQYRVQLGKMVLEIAKYLKDII